MQRTYGWPSSSQDIEFDGRSFRLIPPEDGRYPAAGTIRRPDEHYEEAWDHIAQFLSALCWAQQGPFRVFEYGGSGRGLHPLGGFSYNCQDFLSTYNGQFPGRVLWAPSDAQRFILACWREGMSLHNIAPRYAFQSFWKIIEYARPDSQIDYCNAVIPRMVGIPRLADHFAMEGLAWIGRVEKPADIGRYLYQRGRNASAHAKRGRILSNPDDIREEDRLRRCVPIVESIAKVCLLEEFGLPQPSAMWLR